jgi:hypothetical protein
MWKKENKEQEGTNNHTLPPDGRGKGRSKDLFSANGFCETLENSSEIQLRRKILYALFHIVHAKHGPQ